MRVLVLLACLAAAACADKARFDNYEVYRVVPSTQDQLTALHALEMSPNGLSFWTEANRIGGNVDIMVPPHKLPEFKDLMNRLNIINEVFIANLQENIDNENPAVVPKAMDWTSYHRLDEIYTWMDELAGAHPEVESVVGGSTFEGRQIRGVKVTYGTDLPIVFIEAGIHAREWISPATATWILNQVVTSTDPAVRSLVESYNWHVFPSFNPDGYEYTHTDDRLWRKTRSISPQVACYGADPNRNWGFHWMEGGSSSISCTDTFAGTSAFSEIETKSLSEYIASLGPMQVYLDFHSYSQYIMIPYGLDTEVIDNLPLHRTIGNKAVTAIGQRYGTRYVSDTIVALVNTATGGSVDWVKGVLGAKIVFAFELRDQGQFGFVLPASQIIPTAQETSDAVFSILEDSLSV